jgi:hypothetical protein
LIHRDKFPSDLIGALIFFMQEDSGFMTGQLLLVEWCVSPLAI